MHASTHSASSGVITPDCVVALGSFLGPGQQLDTPCGFHSRSVWSHTALVSESAPKDFFVQYSQPAHFSGDLSSCRPSLETACGCSLLPAFHKVSQKIALTEQCCSHRAWRDQGETSSRPWHVQRALLVKDQAPEAAKHISPGAWADLSQSAVYTLTDIFPPPKWGSWNFFTLLGMLSLVCLTRFAGT